MKNISSFFGVFAVIIALLVIYGQTPEPPIADADGPEIAAQAQVNLQMQINDLRTRMTELEARCKCGQSKASGASRVRTYFFTTQGCQPCEVLKQGINTELLPIGWTVGSYAGQNSSDRYDIEIVEDQNFADRMGVSVYPTVVVTVDGQEVSRTTGVGGGAGALSVWINQIRQQVK